MSRLLTRKDKVFYRPWLLDEKSLTELDEIFDSVYNELSTVAESDIKADVESYMQSRFTQCNTANIEEYKNSYETNIKRIYDVRKALNIYFKDDDVFECQSFNESISNTQIESKTPYGFLYEVSYPQKKVVVKISINDSVGNDCLVIKTSPQDNKIADKACGNLVRWANKHRKNYLVSFIHKHRNIVIFILFAIILSLLLSIGDHDKIAIQSMKPQVQNILTTGVNDSNRDISIEMLLRKSFLIYEYSDVDTSKTILQIKILVYFLVGLVIFCIASHFPTTSLAIGRVGTDKLKRWEWFYKALWVTIPGVIAVGLLKQIVSWVF